MTRLDELRKELVRARLRLASVDPGTAFRIPSVKAQREERALQAYIRGLEDELNGTQKTVKNETAQRAAWLRDELQRRKWTVYDLAREAGDIDARTIRKVLDGQPVRANTLDKLRSVFRNLP